MTRLSRYRLDEKKHKKRALILAIMMIVLSVFDFFTSSSVSAASSYTTRVNLSSDQVKQNGNITLTADAIENGSTATSGYTYRFLYNTDGGTSAYPLGDYSGQNWYSFKSSDISKLKDYTGAVFIFADSKKGSTNVWSKYKILNIIPADKIFPLFRTFAYALIIFFAGVNALETALQYEMFTLRGGVKILARLTFAKIWVDVSLIVCRGIVAIATDWLGQITQLTADIANSLNVGVSLQHSDAWIIGWLIDFFNGLLLAAEILLLLIPLVVLILIMFVKLFIRYFELAMLQCVSPVFFACLTGEATKQYFKKFILTYISVVVEVVFMALI